MSAAWQLLLNHDGVEALSCMGSGFDQCGDPGRHSVTVICRSCGQKTFDLCEDCLDILLCAVGEFRDRYAAYCGDVVSVRHEVLAVERVKAMAVTRSRVPWDDLAEVLKKLHRKSWEPGAEQSDDEPPF